MLPPSRTHKGGIAGGVCFTDLFHEHAVNVCPCSKWVRTLQHGGATTTGPDATHPPAICQNSGGGGGGAGGRSGGGQLGGVGGGFWPWGGFPKVGGLARDPLLPHAYLLGGVCLGGWGYGGMYAMIALSCHCREESLKGRRVAPLPPPPFPLRPCSPPRPPLSL